MRNCIYRIINKINNKVYIGSTIDGERRKLQHFSQLEKNVHINTHLQNSYNKYGKHAFIFDVIEEGLDENELAKREQHYINLFNASDSRFGYNMSSYASHPDNRKYTKVYTVKLREFMKRESLSLSSKALLVHLQICIERYTNRIAKPDGSNFTNKELIDFVGLSPKTLKNTLNELERGGFIRRFGKSWAREIYFNPYIATAGLEVQQKTYDMFKEVDIY